MLRNKERGTRNTGCFCLSFLFALFLLAGCSTPQPSSNQSLKRFGFNSTHMGTMFQITLYAPDEASARTAAQAAFVRVAALDEIMSDYQADSELMRLCDEPPGQPVRVSTDLFDILEQSQHFSELCNGAFDVTVGPFVRLWRLARKKKVLPTPAELSTAAASVGYRKYDLDRKKQTVTLLVPNMRLDLGGIAKGYAAEEALAVLKGRGLPRALVAASGDIAVGYPPPGQRGWKVAIAGMEPLKADKAGTVLLHNAGISTSGDAEQHIEIGGTRYSHILDPATGIGLTHPIQVTIIAPNATTTDALATGVSVMGLQRGLALVDSLPGTAALVLTRSDGKERVWASRRFKSIAVKE